MRLCDQPRRGMDRLGQRGQDPQDLGRSDGSRTSHPHRPHRCVTACAISPDGALIVSASEDEPSRSGTRRRTPNGPPSPATPTGHCLCDQPRRSLYRLGQRGQDPQDLGRGDGRRTGHPLRPHRWGRSLRDQPRRGLYRLCQLGQDPQGLGRSDGRRRATLTGHTDRSMPARSAPTGPGSSPPAGTRPSSLGRGDGRRTGHPHRPHRWVNACAISPDGTFIVSASWDKTLKVWDARRAPNGPPSRW